MSERSSQINGLAHPARWHLAVPFTAVELQDGLWAPRQKAVRERTVPFLYAQYEKNGLFEALDVDSPPGPLRIPFNGRPNTAVMYWDSDIAKWIETASYTLATHYDPALDARIDDLVARIAKAQRPDGYFNTYFIRREPAKRWTNLRDWHELYCAGHMIEAAVAHAQATGKQDLIEVVRRYADYIATIFGPGPNQRRGYCGHPEIELALVKLYRLTGARSYLDLAKFFVDERGRQPHYFDQEAIARSEDPAAQYYGTYEYSQSHTPVREQREVVGHAVRAMYLYSAMADLAGEFDDVSLMAACKALWADVTTKRLYVTGGLGPSERNEGFTADYDLPNETAYAETCAAVGMIFWAHRMLLVERDARYADIMELALYNGALSGLSLDGERFFYDNPLASRGGHRRWTWHRCPCCPPNIGRLVASLGQYVYSTGPDEAAVHLYIASNARLSVGGVNVSLQQKTQYPWKGEIEILVEPEKTVEFALRLRVPAWCRSASLAINGTKFDIEATMDRGYAHIKRRWQKGDEVKLSLDMPAERVYANPEVLADVGRVVLKRGPIIYCLEGADNDAPTHRIALPKSNPIEAHFERNLLSGVGMLTAEAVVVQSWEGGELYRTDPPTMERTTLRAIPYSFWSNRDSEEMSVWIREV
ncbi:glycoside hydrolase family 127 protein [Rhodoferax sp.]|uniref:glycoside hydrolase family 127 protein n=1 Tax=Rhodoferax sp. TaxID=50421 RepID=UPI002717D5F5|nr:beta-L-arabinofuranosidase domain-containing protein [Rhodoferax sp.]MDO8319413.1 glycoside hydrolase family 127 protein [Rhodoferax sp.]